MDITVYLPDEIGQRAKAADLKFSRLLRDAVELELERADMLAQAVDGMTEHVVETMDGDPVRLRFTGKSLSSDGETTVWLLEDGRVLLEDSERYDEFAGAEEFGDWVSGTERNNLGGSAEHVLREVVGELRIVPVIDL